MGLDKVFAVNMCKKRKSLGLSQDALGELCGLTGNHVGTIERGEHSPTLRTMAAIATALEISVLDLLTPHH